MKSSGLAKLKTQKIDKVKVEAHLQNFNFLHLKSLILISEFFSYCSAPATAASRRSGCLVE